MSLVWIHHKANSSQKCNSAQWHFEYHWAKWLMGTKVPTVELSHKAVVLQPLLLELKLVSSCLLFFQVWIQPAESHQAFAPSLLRFQHCTESQTSPSTSSLLRKNLKFASATLRSHLIVCQLLLSVCNFESACLRNLALTISLKGMHVSEVIYFISSQCAIHF